MLPFLLAAIVATPSPEALSAESIFLRARSTVNASAVPPFVVFTYQNSSENVLQSVRGVTHFFQRDRLRFAVRTVDGHAFVQTLRLPMGMRVNWKPVVVGDDAKFPNTVLYRAGDFPMADFGLRLDASRPGLFEAREKPASRSGQGLKVIGSAETNDLPYAITRLEDATVDGRPMFHLTLLPVRDPRHNVLREVWVDQQTFAPRRYVVDRFVGSPPEFDYLVTVDTSFIDGYLINSEGRGPIDTLTSSGAGKTRRTADASWSISNLSFPATLPDWLFDPTAFRAHRKDPLPVELSATPVHTMPSPLPSIRHLVFDCRVQMVNVSDSRSADNARASSAEPGVRSTYSGQIIVDVVGATTDGGLIVDITQTDVGEAVLPTRIRISGDGALLGTPATELTQEETVLLKLLARAAIGPTPRHKGEAWAFPQTADDRGATRYRVIDAPSANKEVLELNEGSNEQQPQPGDESVQGIVTYDPLLSVPESVSIVARTASAGASVPHETDTKIGISLIKDSFATGH